jgi:hypothetical protein
VASIQWITIRGQDRDKFQGTEDNIAPAELARAYVDGITAPQKEFVPIMGAGHVAMIARNDEFLTLLDQWVPQSVAQAISGHKTRAVFERYNIVDERDLRDAGRKLETYLNSQNGDNSGTIESVIPSRPTLTN